MLLEAQEYARIYPSRAEDSNTKKRFVQYIITRVLNKMNSLMEVSDTQAAAALLGMDSGVCSDIFSAYDPTAYMEYMMEEKYPSKSCSQNEDNDRKAYTGNEISDEYSVGSFLVDDSDNSSDSNEEKDKQLSHDDSSEFSESEDNQEGNVSTLFKDAEQNEQETRVDGDEDEDQDCPYEECAPTSGHFRYTPLFRVDGGERLEPVRYPALYRNRGPNLAILSRYEYCTQVKVELKKKDDNYDDDESANKNQQNNSTKVKRGRKRSKAFEFGENFILQPSHVQRLRTKLCTLKLYKSPPPHPGKRPADSTTETQLVKWKKKANKYGAFFLMLFRPEEDLYEDQQENQYKYNWKEFVAFYNSLKKGSRFDQMRYRTMQGYMHGWRTTPKSRAILSSHRGRKRTLWSHQEQQEAKKRYGKKSTQGTTFYDDEDDIPDMTGFQLSNREAIGIMKNVSHSDDMSRTLKGITTLFENPTNDSTDESTPSLQPQQTSHYKVEVNPADTLLAETILEKVTFGDDLDDDGTHNEDEDEESTADNSTTLPSIPEEDGYIDLDNTVEQYNSNSQQFYIDHGTKQRVDNYIEETNMSGDKMLAVSVMRNHYQSMYDGLPAEYEAPLLLITGGPGVGKSFLVEVLDNTSKMMRVGDQLRMALFGIAAINIDGASLMAMMNIPTEFNRQGQQKVNPWKPDKLRQFQNMYDTTKISAIVIDEISTVKPYMLAYLNARLQEACASTLPFGGKALVMLGDFDQLPPAGGPSLPELAMMIEKERRTGNRVFYNKKNFEITSIVRQGAELFKRAYHIKLTEQHRSEDEEHTNLLERMSNGETIGPEDLSVYKTISHNDTEFEFATILTPGNRDRHDYNNIQSQRWAHRHQTNIIRWPRRIRNKTWKGKPRDPRNVARAKEESSFWELFIPSALAYLTFNLNMMKGLANGLPVKYHSISFFRQEEQQQFELLLDAAKPGETITLEQPPDMINVEIFPDFPGDTKKERDKNKVRREQWKHGSITTTDGKIVIPINVSAKKYVKWKPTQVRGGGSRPGLPNFHPSKVELADFFPIEPGFSITIHKAQVSQITLTKNETITIFPRHESFYSHILLRGEQ